MAVTFGLARALAFVAIVALLTALGLVSTGLTLYAAIAGGAALVAAILAIVLRKRRAEEAADQLFAMAQQGVHDLRGDEKGLKHPLELWSGAAALTAGANLHQKHVPSHTRGAFVGELAALMQTTFEHRKSKGKVTLALVGRMLEACAATENWVGVEAAHAAIIRVFAQHTWVELDPGESAGEYFERMAAAVPRGKEAQGRLDPPVWKRIVRDGA